MSTEQNKEVSRRYHDLKPEEMDDLIAQNFIGHGTGEFTWTLEMHKENWKKLRGKMHDTIHEQVAEGSLVATRFIREGTREGKRLKAAMMSFKRFENGKIAEIWELWASQEAD